MASVRAVKSRFKPSNSGLAVLRQGKILAIGESPAEMIERVAKTIFSVELKFNTAKSTIRRLMADFIYYCDNKQILMSTPIMTNAGRYEDRPFSACAVPYVDLNGDRNTIIKSVDTFHLHGMGTGFNLDETENPVQILKFLNQIAVNGAESGREDRPVGNMAILSVHHPKIHEFIASKIDAESKGIKWKFNISINVSKQFMEAADANTEYTLTNGKSLNAQEVIHLISTAAHSCGDPGMVFMDRMKQDNPVPSVGDYFSTAPCGEVGLSAGETCQFGYVNLGRFVIKKNNKNVIDYTELKKAVTILTRVLDNALEISIDRYHDDKSKQIMSQKRKIGIGVCGLADMFIALDIQYDSPTARQLTREVISFINYYSKRASHDLAKSRGSFLAFNESSYVHKKGYIENRYGQKRTKVVTPKMWKELANDIRSSGCLRNCSTIALPPTGRSGLVIDASTGIEPIFSLKDVNYTRELLIYKLSKYQLRLDPILTHISQYGTLQDLTYIPEKLRKIFKTALEIKSKDHLLITASAQEFTDESVSKTINMLEASVPTDVSSIYLLAYQLKLKGVTIFRTGCLSKQPRQLAKV